MTSSKKLEKPQSSARSSSPKPKPAPPIQTPAVVPQTPLDKISAIRQGIKNTYGAQITAFVRTPPADTKRTR